MAEDQNPNPQNREEEEDKKKEKGGEEEEEEGEEEESSSQSPPSKVARVSSDAGAVTTAVVSPLGLGLGLGLGARGDETLRTGFTFMQMQEYHHQDLIFKHMMAGIPVPIHLILPIWKSVAASYGPHHYPSFVGLGNLCYDFRNIMEPEPGRCRRTDGKKWRCSRDVVPEQKYCGRHMHRGRNRSRKPVEGAGTTATATATTDPSVTALENDGLADSNDDNNNGNNSTSSGSNVSGSSNDVSVGRTLGPSLISVLSSSTCKTGVS